MRTTVRCLKKFTVNLFSAAAVNIFQCYTSYEIIDILIVNINEVNLRFMRGLNFFLQNNDKIYLNTSSFYIKVIS